MNKAAREAQLQTLHDALPFVKDFSLAIDGGANNGDWASHMARVFRMVKAFEVHREICHVLGIRFAETPNVKVLNMALWKTVGMVDVLPDPAHPRKNIGHYAVAGDSIQAVSVDSLNLSGCGLIKLDIEGAEMLALEGAAETIKEFHPVIICELSGHAERYGRGSREPEQFLKGFGYAPVARRKPDTVFAWRN